MNPKKNKYKQKKMLSNYSFLINLFVFIILIILSNSSLNAPCTYKVARYQDGTNETDVNFLKNINSELAKKQKCFSLSKSDVESSLCCYDKKKLMKILIVQRNQR